MMQGVLLAPLQLDRKGIDLDCKRFCHNSLTCSNFRKKWALAKQKRSECECYIGSLCIFQRCNYSRDSDRSNEQHSQMLNNGWLRKVHLEQFQPSSSTSTSSGGNAASATVFSLLLLISDTNITHRLLTLLRLSP